MATRRKGNIAVDDVIEVAKGMPLDARDLVRNKEEQLDPGSFEYGYKGMLTVNRDEEKLYLLSDHQNPTQEASWKVIGPYDDSALDARVTALENAPPGEQVQANWNETDTTSKAFIQNKPTIPEAYDDTALAARVTAVENGKANTADLAPVATSGSYNDLGDKPTIPEAYDDTEVRGLIAAKANSADLAPVATSGSYNDLGDKPTIPAAYDDTEVRGLIAAKANSADLATVATSGSYNDLGDKPTIPEAYDDTALAARVTAVETNKANSADLATVATSGSYNDLSDKPTIPAEVTVDAAMSSTSENPVQNKVVLAAITDAVDVVEANVYTKTETDAKIAEAMTDVDNNHFHVVTALPDPSVAKENHEYVLVTYAQDGTTIESEVHYLFYDGVFHQRTTQISLDGYATEAYVGEQLGTLATVAESGSYTDLSDKPTIPEAYDDTALAARVTAVEDGKASLQVAAIPGGGGGEEINALVSQGENSVSVSYYKDGALPNILNLNVDSDYFTVPTTGYVDEKAAQAQNSAQIYADLKLTQKQDKLVSGSNIKTVGGESVLGSGNIDLPVVVGSLWGIAKTGSVNVSHSGTSVSVSDLGITSVDDYQVSLVSASNYSSFYVVKRINNFTIYSSSSDSSDTLYTVFVKGYGGVPNGGTTGQVLAKKSNADGDTEWVPGGGGINIEVGAERWYGTYTDENGVTYQVYSKMIYIPALPAAAGIETYSHGISGIRQILQVYGFTTDGFVLNAPRQNAQDNIAIYQMSKSATNQTLSIEVGKDRSNKAAYVCMVYAKNN